MDLRLANDLKWWWLSIEEHKKMSFLWTVALMFIALVVVRMSRWLYRQEILTDTDVNSEIFRQENKSFVCTIFEGSQSVFGKDNVFLEHGNIHKQIKQITLQLLGSEGLKRKMIGDMDRATREHLQSKANDGSFNVKDTVASARKVAIKMIQDVFKRRRASSEKYGDFLDTMLEELEKDGSFFNDESAIGLIFIISVITQETTSSSIVLIMKFLSENPKVVAELKREHEMILQDRDDEQSGVSWEEYRQKMSFTNMVINESLRLGSMAPVQFKKAVEDVEINGYTIPAGWTVAVAPAVVHCDPHVYENPFEFNPWRWEGKEVRTGSKTFLAFGVGVRQCVGAEFARLQMSIFIHYLVTNYDFSLAQKCEVIRTPLPQFSNGLHFNISKSY